MKGSVTRRGRASWRIKLDVPNAGGERKTVYETVRGSKGKAQQRLAELVASIGRGTFVEPSATTIARHVAARIDLWQAAGEIGDRTAEGYRKLLQHSIAPHIGDAALQRLSTADVEKWHGTLRTAGLAPRTIGHAHRVLSKALGDAVRHGQLVRNVAGREGQRAPKVVQKEMKVLTADEIGGFVDRLRGHPLFAQAMVALFCGARSAEVLALKWSSIQGTMLNISAAVEELDGQIPTLKAPKTEAGRRRVSMPDIVVDALRDHRRQVLEQRMALGQGRMPDDALVFPSPTGEPLRPSNLSAQWGRAVAALKLPRVRYHDLRHTHCSQLIASGLDVVLISKRLGHNSPTTTLRIYAHLWTRTDAAAADAINRALGANSVPKTG